MELEVFGPRVGLSSLPVISHIIPNVRSMDSSTNYSSLIKIPSAIIGVLSIYFLIVINDSVNFNSFKPTYQTGLDSNLTTIQLCASALGYMLSIIVPKTLKKKDSVSSFEHFQSQLVHKYAMLQMPAFFGLVVFKNTFNENQSLVFSYPWLCLIAYIISVTIFMLELPKLVNLARNPLPGWI